MKNIQLILSAILSKDIFHYIQIDKAFNIVSYSYGVEKFFPNMQEVIGKEVYEYFPELIGMEDELIKPFFIDNYRCKLDRVQKNNYYINLTIEYCDPQTLLILIQDDTATIQSQQELLQYSNDLTLLNNTLQTVFDQQKDLIFLTNKESIKFANKKFIELFDKTTIEEIQEEKLRLYKAYNSAFQSYDELFEALVDKTGRITINGEYFIIQTSLVDTSHKLFTMTEI